MEDHTGKKRNKTFQVGNIEIYDQEIDDHTRERETAIEFKQDYKKHWDNNTLEKVDDSRYADW